MIADVSRTSKKREAELQGRLTKRRDSIRNFERSIQLRALFHENDDQSTKLPCPEHASYQKYDTSIPFTKMPTGFDARAGGDPVQIKNKKQSMADLKLRRLTELNLRLREDLDRPRIKVSDAAMGLINYTSQTRDFMVPQMWGTVDKRDDPYAPQQSAGCCTVM
ncbi:MAG: hypothetical protein M1837_002809 [Sclerophora amabilis]|nr:MAG: hypothetical protein M1837_002809 [Sclerophora amabilis]